ncbi:MAG TPA: YciI family protein [Usitatibacter sp.]|nr:YciI family protein [Usitatibacter sp.]
MRFLSMIRIDEKAGQRPSERLMTEMGKLMEEATREGWLVSTAGLRPTVEGKRMRWNRGKLTTTDGPFVETKEVIGGYAVLEAKSMAEAVKLTERFLRVHGDEWNVECELRALDGPEFGEDQRCRAPAATAAS